MKANVPSDIPDELHERLAALRSVLELNGSIRLRRRDGIYRLRVRVPDDDLGRVRVSIRIGDEQTAYAVQALLDDWREDRAAREAEEERRREEARAYKAKVRELKRRLVASAGGSARRKRRAREFDRAAETPWTLYAYLASGSYALSDVRPGPKRRGGLC